ncbi:hypothetical protein P168DRAFT_212288, partial [Aspergillus campestris IBT 28561]
SFHEELLDKYPDADLFHHITSSPKCASSNQVFYLSPNLIAKYHDPSEIADVQKAIEVATHRGIPSPSILKTIKVQGCAYTIMNRIEGDTLDILWKDLPWFMTIKLGLQLRRCVKALRSVTSPTAGSLATGEIRSFYLEDRFGLPAHSRPTEIAHFTRFWGNFTGMRRALQVSKQQPQIPYSPD